MSIDYTKALVHRGTVIAGFVANSTKPIPGITGTSALAGTPSYLFGAGTLFKVLRIDILITTAATEATQSFIVQKSDSAGAWGAPTTMGTVTILSTNAASSLLSHTVAAASTDVDNSNGTNLYKVRFAHVATATDASLAYEFAVYYTPPHC